MENERSSRGSQQQFSIYSNKGGIVVKEEVSSEKAFTKVVKDICIDESSQPLMERNVSLNFDHSVVDGVIAMEMAREPVAKIFSGPIASENDVSGALNSSGPIKMKKLGGFANDSGVPQKLMDEVVVAQKHTKTTPPHDTITTNQADSTMEDNAMDNSFNTEVIKHPLVNENHATNTSPNERKSTDNDDRDGKTKNPSEENGVTGTLTGTGMGTGEKPVSLSKERAQNQVASPTKMAGNNTIDSGLSSSNVPSVPSTPTSPIPNSDSISNRSDSTSTSNRSFAFPVLPREWTSSPVKMEKPNKSRSRKCRGCSALFCCHS